MGILSPNKKTPHIAVKFNADIAKANYIQEPT